MKPDLSSLSENEINSGKIWTLLRYNKAFQKDVKWFAAKYKTATNKRAKQETRENAKGEFHTKYQEIEDINPFAATALQWMFPMPVFVNWNEDNQNQSAGWGPYVQHKQEGDKIDAFAEWKEYEAAKDFLSLETNWFSVNAGFKRDLIFQYGKIDSRTLNPITKDRSDTTFPHETDFFKDFDLNKLINNGPSLDVHAAAKIMTANELKRDYRIFALPRHMHTREAVDEAFEILKKKVKELMPRKASEPFGTEQAWKNYMLLRRIQSQKNCSKKVAIISMATEHSPLHFPSESRRTYETRMKKNIESIEDKISRCYPRFNF